MAYQPSLIARCVPTSNLPFILLGGKPFFFVNNPWKTQNTIFSLHVTLAKSPEGQICSEGLVPRATWTLTVRAHKRTIRNTNMKQLTRIQRTHFIEHCRSSIVCVHFRWFCGEHERSSHTIHARTIRRNESLHIALITHCTRTTNVFMKLVESTGTAHGTRGSLCARLQCLRKQATMRISVYSFWRMLNRACKHILFEEWEILKCASLICVCTSERTCFIWVHVARTTFVYWWRRAFKILIIFF